MTDFNGELKDFKKMAQKNAFHIETLNKEMGEVKVGQDNMHNSIKTITREMLNMKVTAQETKTDVSWLKKNHWIIMRATVGAALAAIGALIVGLINLAK